MTVYLIHFDRRIGRDGRNGAQHYIGYSTDGNSREATHRKNKGARILAYLNREDIGWRVVREWEGATLTFERRLKRGGHFDQYCPVCSPSPRNRKDT